MSDEARALFKEGVAHLTASEPDYAAAYEAFKAAYADSPSPKILGNLGLCATKLERDGEAIDAYETYLSDAGAKSLKERRQISQDLRELKKRGSILQLTVTPHSLEVVDERERDAGPSVTNSYTIEGGAMQLRVHAGKHRLRFQAPGYQARVVELQLAAGATELRDVALEAVAVDEPPAEEPQRVQEPEDESDALPIATWTGLALTGSLAVATVVVGSLAWSNKGSYDDALAAGDEAEAADLRDGGETLNVAGDVLLGLTVAVGTASAVLLVLELSGDDDEADEVAVRWAPQLSPQGGGLAVWGAF